MSNIVELYGRRYDLDDGVDAVELIFDENFGLDSDIPKIIEKTGGNIARIWKRAQRLGWEYTGEAHSCANDIVELVMYDPQKKKHWLRFDSKGNAWFDSKQSVSYLFGWMT